MIAGMDKVKIEVTLAVLLGLFVGIFITMGATGRLQKNPKNTSLATPAIVKTAPAVLNNNGFLTIPDMIEQYVATSTFQLKGKTNPSAKLIISSDQEEKYFKTGITGEFREAIALWPGKNLIKVMILNSDKNIYKEIEVYYFPEK